MHINDQEFSSQLLLICFLMVCASLLNACTNHNSSDEMAVKNTSSIIYGAITYRERIALPPNSMALITLSDISRVDVRAPVLAEQSLDLKERSVPIAFELKVDTSLISEPGQYAVRAVIRGPDDKLLWTTDHVVLIDQTKSEQDLKAIQLVKVN